MKTAIGSSFNHPAGVPSVINFTDFADGGNAFFAFDPEMDQTKIPQAADFVFTANGISLPVTDTYWENAHGFSVDFSGVSNPPFVLSYTENATRRLQKLGDPSIFVPSFTNLILPYTG